MIPVSKPRAINDDIFHSIMESGMFTNNGELVRALERRLEARLRIPHFVAMSNGTAALEAAISLLFKPGDIVAIPSFTFVAVVTAVVRCGCHPRFVDITPDTWVMSYDALMDAEEVQGVIIVNTFGVAPDRRFLDVGCPLLYDNAEGFGSHTGMFADMDVYSLHATKIVNSAEGGGIACADDGHYEHLRRWRNFGFDGTNKGVEFAGTNAKMSEFHAALAHGSLYLEDNEVVQRRRLLDMYKDRLNGSVQFQIGDSFNCVTLTERRDEVERALAENRIDSRPYFYPLHRMPAFSQNVELPITDYVSERALALPLWAGMTEEMVDRICDIVKGEL